MLYEVITLVVLIAVVDEQRIELIGTDWFDHRSHSFIRCLIEVFLSYRAGPRPASEFLNGPLYITHFRWGNRITSYNVCYTKLLRIVPADSWSTALQLIRAGKIDVLPAAMVSDNRLEFLSFTEPYVVITSYSIHYTKLYDVGSRRRKRCG